MRLITRDPQRDYRWALAAVFVAWLAVPLAWQATRLAIYWLGAAADARMRITLDDLGAVDRWFARTFPQRGQLFGLYNKIRHHAFGQLPAAVVEGVDGWLFWRSESAGEPGLDDFAGQVVPPPGEIARWREALIARRAGLAARGIVYLVAIAPSKHTIYPDRLPLALQRQRGRSRLDQVVAAFAGRVDGFLDLRPTLLQAREREQVYYRTDTHWNGAGAYAAYRTIVETVAAQRSGLAPSPRECFRIEPARHVGDIGRMIEVPFAEQTERWTWAEPSLAGCRAPQPDGRRPTLVVFGDSFMPALLTFLQGQFDVVATGGDFSDALVQRLRPDLVLHEIVERNLPRLLDEQPEGAPATR
jgi:hypothetical protein